MRGKRMDFDDVVNHHSAGYALEDVTPDDFQGKEFGCKVWKTHVDGWFLTDYDYRYYDHPDIYLKPSLTEKTGHVALFQDIEGLMNAKYVNVKILRHRKHAEQYIDKLLGK